MTFAYIFIALLSILSIDQGFAIKCFNCAVTTQILVIGSEKIVTPSCLHFDGSSTYIVDCPFSTMCSRIISTMYLQKGYEQRTFTLGCAQQKLSRHVLNNGKWTEEHSVEEIYSEDCKTMNENDLVGATKTYCYCRGNLCNSGNRQYVLMNSCTFVLGFFLINSIINR